MISLSTWIRIRNRLDAYFRGRALRPGLIRATGERFISVDVEDVMSSDSAKRARRAAYFLAIQDGRPPVHATDVEIMRKSYKDLSSMTHAGHLIRLFDGRIVLELESETCEFLRWQEGDRIGFRRLYSGELLTSVDRSARR